jgi:D-alanine-D-alanine ligase
MDRNIILLFGGDSDERLVSVASAQTMAQTIRPQKLWFWHHEGPVFEVSYDELIGHKNPFTNTFLPNNLPSYNNIIDAISSRASEQHVFLLGVHGGFGENGDLQELCERFHRPYTGSSSHASRLAFNKVATKECLRGTSINVAPHLILDNPQTADQLLSDFLEKHKEVIIKPVCGGSSIGCFYAHSRTDLVSAIEHLKRLSPISFLAEKVIVGREITVGVFDTKDGPLGLPCTEIVLEKERDFDYEGKYLGRGSKEITPAHLPISLAAKAQQIAVTAHSALHLFGYSRADMILSGDEFYFLETNTLPGMSKQSLIPQQLVAAGISIKDFLLTQIAFAHERSLR